MSKTVNSAAAAKKEAAAFKGDLHEIAKPKDAAAGAPKAPPPAKEKTPEEAAEEARLAQLREEHMVQGEKRQGGGSKSVSSKTKLWTTKKYKKEYEKSVRELKRTRKRFMNYMKRKIV